MAYIRKLWARYRHVTRVERAIIRYRLGVPR